MASGERNMGQLGDFTFKDWVLSIPPVTRFLFIGSGLFTACVALFGLGPWAFLLHWPPIFSRFQILRLIGTFFYAPHQGISLLIHFYFLYNYSYQVETTTFYGKIDEYAWMLFVVCTTMLTQSLITPNRFFSMQQLISPSFFYSPALVLAIIHVWGFNNRNTFVSLYGMIRVPAKYLSLVMLGLEFVMNKGEISVSSIQGLLAGHFYYFMRNEYPTVPDGQDLLQMPVRFSKFVMYLHGKINRVTGLEPEAEPQGVQRQQASTGSSNVRDVGSLGRGSQQGGGSAGRRSGITMPRLRTGGYDWGSGRTLGSD